MSTMHLRAASILSGKSQLPMSQLLCNTSGKADGLNAIQLLSLNYFICMPGRFDYG